MIPLFLFFFIFFLKKKLYFSKFFALGLVGKQDFFFGGGANSPNNLAIHFERDANRQAGKIGEGKTILDIYALKKPKY